MWPVRACLAAILAAAASAEPQLRPQGLPRVPSPDGGASEAHPVALAGLPFVPVKIAHCGNYCGPHWCNGQDLSEAQCDTSAPPQSGGFLNPGPSCTDACCRAHDRCCGHEAQNQCNRLMVACLQRCGPLDMSCMDGPVPVPAGIIQKVMQGMENWCCGRPCWSNDTVLYE